MSSDKNASHGDIVWSGKPWITPAAIIRTVTFIVFIIIFLWLEFYANIALTHLAVLPIYAWTIVALIVVWIFSLLDILIFRASHSYVLRQDGLEIRSGIIRLHSFVVTPPGFGDLMVYQSVGGRIFGYGDLTVNSQGERETRLVLVRKPFAVADTMRDIMGKPIVRVENKV